MSKRAKPPVLLLGSYGRGNIGDDIFLLAALELLGDRTIYINSSDDELLPAAARGRVKTLATNGGWKSKIKALRDIKHVVYWGGDTWVKWYGDRFPRQLLYKMIVINLAARLMGKKVYYVGTGIGKLSGYSLFLARTSARLANRIIAREQRSAKLLNTGNITVFPDLAVNLPYYNRTLHALPAKGKKFTVGISLLYYLPDPEINFPKLIERVAALVKSLPQDKFRVVLYPMLVTQQVPNDDLWASEQLAAALTKNSVEILHLETLEDAVRVLGTMDLLIGTRLHANILGSFSATPCLGIAYRPKVASFFVDNDLSDYCITLDQLDELEATFWDMYNHYDQVAQRFHEVSTSNVAQHKRYLEFVDEACK